jgi:Xaa-Pro aminopeptidase
MTQLTRFQSTLKCTSADCALITSELNIRYLCGFNFSDGALLVFPERAYLLTDFRYIEAARAAVSDFFVTLTDRKSIKDTVRDILAANGAKTVALEDCDVSVSQFKKLRDTFKDITFTDGISEILKNQRAVKLDYELDLISKAQSITDAAFAHILGFISPRVTERELALELEFFMRQNGAEATAFDTIAISGSSSSLPHGVPSDKKLSSGFLTMDFGARYNGYCSDMTRTVVLGKANADMKKLYNTVLSAQNAALGYIGEGVGCKATDKVARDIIDGAGYEGCFGHSLGHGVGMYIHETPSLSQYAKDSDVLKRGNVVTVEPGIYIEGKHGCRIEDMVAISNDGTLINFTKSQKELIEI